MKVGYSEATLTQDTLSDGSRVFGVFVSGDRDIQIDCVDEDSANNLISVWNHSVVNIDIS